MVETSVTNLQLLNAALVRLGEKTVTQISGSPPAVALYDQVRLAFLDRYSWRFATVRVPMSRLTQAPASDFAYFFAFPTVPSVVKELDIQLSIPSAEYQVETIVDPLSLTASRVLATNATAAVLRYVGDIEEALWSPLARLAFSKLLAAELSTQVSGKRSLRQVLVQEAELAVSQAIVSDQSRDTPKRMEIDSRYVDARKAGAGFDPDRRGGVPEEDLII